MGRRYVLGCMMSRAVNYLSLSVSLEYHFVDMYLDCRGNGGAKGPPCGTVRGYGPNGTGLFTSPRHWTQRRPGSGDVVYLSYLMILLM